MYEKDVSVFKSSDIACKMCLEDVYIAMYSICFAFNSTYVGINHNDESKISDNHSKTHVSHCASCIPSCSLQKKENLVTVCLIMYNCLNSLPR